jgi:RNA polymerase sigma factor (sigma-70 family)
VRLSDYLDQLPLQQRVAIVLRHGLDYTVDEIADATATSRNTVKYRLKEALSTIRRLVRRDLAMRGKRHDG